MGGPGFGKGKGKGKGKGFGGFNSGPPAEVMELGEMLHACEDQMVCKCTSEKVPYFNGRIFLENKAQIGQVDEILGPINNFMFSVKMQEGMSASSFKPNQKVYIDPQQMLPMDRFLPKPSIKKEKGTGGKGKGGKGKGSFGFGGKGKGKGGFGGGFGKGKGKGRW
jgi:H/ACA ribonucleoprotein complex subunit 1